MKPDLIFNGVQKIPGYVDQWVFTDLRSGSTFYTEVGISDEELSQETTRVREKFGVPALNPTPSRKYVALNKPDPEEGSIGIRHLHRNFVKNVL